MPSSHSSKFVRYTGAVANHVSLLMGVAAMASGVLTVPGAASTGISYYQVCSFWDEEIPADNAFIRGKGVHLSDTELEKARRVNNAYLKYGGVSGPVTIIDHVRW